MCNVNARTKLFICIQILTSWGVIAWRHVGRFHAAQTQPAASLRLPQQPAWNDARGGILV